MFSERALSRTPGINIDECKMAPWLGAMTDRPSCLTEHPIGRQRRPRQAVRRRR
jgi:hypothetical protein